MKNWSKADVA